MFQGLKHLFSLSFIKLMKNHYLGVDYAVTTMICVELPMPPNSLVIYRENMDTEKPKLSLDSLRN